MLLNFYLTMPSYAKDDFSRHLHKNKRIVKFFQTLQSHMILTMSHWSSGLVCFPPQGTQVQSPWGDLCETGILLLALPRYKFVFFLQVFFIFAIFVFRENHFFRNLGSFAKLRNSRNSSLTFAKHENRFVASFAKFSRNEISSKTLIDPLDHFHHLVY
jgi:hypothetical protein